MYEEERKTQEEGSTIWVELSVNQKECIRTIASRSPNETGPAPLRSAYLAA